MPMLSAPRTWPPILVIRSPAVTAGSHKMGTCVSSHHGLADGGGTNLVSTLVWEDPVSKARYGSPVSVSRISRSALAWLTATVTSMSVLDAEDDPDVANPDAEDAPDVLAAAGPTDSTCTLGSTTRVWTSP